MGKNAAFVKKGKDIVLTAAIAIAILVGAGYAAAESWDDDRRKKKLGTLAKTIKTAADAKLTGDAAEACDAMLEAVAEGGTIHVKPAPSDEEESDDDDESEEEADDEEADDEEEADEEESDDESEEESEDEDESEEESEEESEDEAEEESEEESEEEEAEPVKPSKKDKKATKPAKAEKPAKATKETKPAKAEKKKADKGEKKSGIQKVGVIDAIVDILKNSAIPLKKADIAAKLATKFPDRDAEGLKATVGVQVPYYLSKKGHEILKIDGGFVIPNEKHKAAKKAAKAEKAEKAAAAKESKPAAAAPAEKSGKKSDKKPAKK